jgi:hypothetical protein
MKKIALALSLVLGASILVPTVASARPHKVCNIHHHHRVCHWVH